MKNFKKLSEEKIIENATTDLDSFGTYLVSGTVHGKPGLPTAELDRIIQILRKRLSSEEQFLLAVKLALRKEYVARALSCALIPTEVWRLKQKRKEILDLMQSLANDSDWIVREWSAGLYGRLLSTDFKYFSDVFDKWVVNKSSNIKRAIALAVKYDSKRRDPQSISAYLNLLEPLMGEADEYIRKNLCPFAIGDGLLPRFPKETLGALTKWFHSDNEHVRWNIAMTFSAAQATPFARDGIKILEQLAKDERRYVWRAVCTALRNLAKKESSFVNETISKWERDPKKKAMIMTAKKIY